MAVSVFDLYKIGIGPSSSHTVGPMRAAARFVERWLVEGGAGDGSDLARTARVRAEVFGSLALTGRGHGTDKAVLMGLEGHWPNLIDPDVIPAALARIRAEKRILLGGRHPVAFNEKTDLVMNKRQKLPFHTNGMRFTAYDAAGAVDLLARGRQQGFKRGGILGRGHQDHAEPAVEHPRHLGVGDAAGRHQPAKDGRQGPAPGIQARCHAGGQHARNVFHEAAAGDVGERLDLAGARGGETALDVDARRRQQRVRQRAVARERRRRV